MLLKFLIQWECQRDPSYWMYPNGTLTTWAREMAGFFAGAQAHLMDSESESINRLVSICLYLFHQ